MRLKLEDKSKRENTKYNDCYHYKKNRLTDFTCIQGRNSDFKRARIFAATHTRECIHEC